MERTLFHLSIPALDLEATVRLYGEGLGCAIGRRSEQGVILNLGGHQEFKHYSRPDAVLGQRGHAVVGDPEQRSAP